MEIIIVCYLAWGVYSGYKLMSGRSEWLDEKKFPNWLVKFLVCALVGTVYGIIYLMALIIKLIFR